ncbi:GFA family protein [Kordiimonas sp.]|uniref:GFA family protein n=1 Tax=Kordiimonas sp. TaxID=1970157 RepID=UPI003A9422EC
MRKLEGGCYCGNIGIQLETEKPFSELVPRACDCDFCTMNGAKWLSHPDAKLEIEIQNEAAINLFEQGSMTARFWLCQRCGVLACVTADVEGERRAAVNVNALNARGEFPPPMSVSPKELSKAEKSARWQDVWIRGVTVKDCWDVGL